MPKRNKILCILAILVLLGSCPTSASAEKAIDFNEALQSGFSEWKFLNLNVQNRRYLYEDFVYQKEPIWEAEGGMLHVLSNAMAIFGSAGWRDYTFRLKIKPVKGWGGCLFRIKAEPTNADRYGMSGKPEEFYAFLTTTERRKKIGYDQKDWCLVYGRDTSGSSLVKNGNGMAFVKGEWNEILVECRDRHISVMLNGSKVVDIETSPEQSVDRGKVGVLFYGDAYFKDISVETMAGTEEISEQGKEDGYYHWENSVSVGEDALSERPTVKTVVFEMNDGMTERTVKVNGEDEPHMLGVRVEGPVLGLTLSSNFCPNIFDRKETVDFIIRDHTLDRERAIAIWKYFMVHFFVHMKFAPSSTSIIRWNASGGYGFCGYHNLEFASWCRLAGLKVRVTMFKKHVASEVYFDGGWHLFDPYSRVYFLSKDLGNIASMEELAKDPDLVRGSLLGITDGDKEYSWRFPDIDLKTQKSQWENFYGFTELPFLYNERECPIKGLSLKSTEVFDYGFEGLGRWYIVPHKRNAPPASYAAKPHNYSNAVITFMPLDSETGINDFEESEDAFVSSNESRREIVCGSKNGTSKLVYKIDNPYWVVGGLMQADIYNPEGSKTAVYISLDNGDTWISVWENEGAGQKKITMDISDYFTAFPNFGYLVKIETKGAGKAEAVRITDLRINTILQINPKTFLRLYKGVNIIKTKVGAFGKEAKMVFSWEEKDSLRADKGSGLEEPMLHINKKHITTRPSPDKKEYEILVAVADVAPSGHSVYYSDDAVDGVLVRCYEGDPERGGRLIGENRIDSIASGEYGLAKIRFDPPSIFRGYHIFVTVHHDGKILYRQDNVLSFGIRKVFLDGVDGLTKEVKFLFRFYLIDKVKNKFFCR